MSHPPSTPTPRRFLLAKRGGAQLSQTPTGPPQFHSTPRFGSSSVVRPTQARTGRDIEEVEEDGIDGSSPEGDDEGGRLKKSVALNDSIEIESDAQTASEDDAANMADGGLDEGDRDSIEPDSLGPLVSLHESSPLEEREPKRRRVSISPMPSSPLQEQDGSIGHVSEDEQGQSAHSARSSSMGSFEDTGTLHDDRKAPQQPTFLAPPRFKPTEVDMLTDGLPVAFSPQRRGTKYLPGGLAAGLQGWLSDIKGWEGVDHAGDVVARVTVEEIRPGRRMYLVKGRVAGTPGKCRQFLLAGEGKLTGLGRRAIVNVGSVVDVGQPVWDVELENEVWTVSCDWSVY
ncbi:hypothetical protein B0T10DRAFT_469369 [Thelonectria olida]|uniref:Uncharacterized protein n=1 Tax=Thelonectria olida TaxID=1576542 RepID=A0A9P9ATL9_9HYPO|nr:hypothetical protein B0T10DRAFT_469369 [Thelonectria olida]